MSLHLTAVHSFSLLYNCAINLSTLLDIWIVASLELLCTMQLWNDLVHVSVTQQYSFLNIAK